MSNLSQHKQKVLEEFDRTWPRLYKHQLSGDYQHEVRAFLSKALDEVSEEVFHAVRPNTVGEEFSYEPGMTGFTFAEAIAHNKAILKMESNYKEWNK